MRWNLALLLLFSCLAGAASAQSARTEKTIDLPAGVLVKNATISHVGSFVAAICSDHAVRVWSVQSGELVRSLDASNEPQTAVQFSNDGRLLAVSYEKGAIKVFDVGSWKLQHELTSSAPMYVLAFSPNNRHLVSAGDFDTDVWDLADQKVVAKVPPPFGWSWAFSFSSDGKLLATADGDAFVRVYDANSGSMRRTVDDLILEPFAVAFSPDGKFILAGGVDKTISIIDPESGKLLRALPKQPGLVWSLDVSADGKQAAAVYRSTEHFLDINHLMLWDLDKGTIIGDFQKPGVTIRGGAFVGDHYLFAASSAYQLTLWSLR